MNADNADQIVRLMLEHQGGQQIIEHADDQKVTLGSAADNDLTVDISYASRSHARIECRGSGFMLVDHSTNGTYVQTEDERISFVHRKALRLWGDGWLSLGEPCDSASVIRYRHY